MKSINLFFFAIISLLIITACDEVGPVVNIPPPVSFSVDAINVAPTGSATDSEIVGKISVKNETSEPLNLMWQKEDIGLPSGWQTAICDHMLCYGTHIVERPLMLEANQEIEIKFNFYPNRRRGQGSSRLSIYVAEDQENTIQTTTFSAEAN